MAFWQIVNSCVLLNHCWYDSSTRSRRMTECHTNNENGWDVRSDSSCLRHATCPIYTTETTRDRTCRVAIKSQLMETIYASVNYSWLVFLHLISYLIFNCFYFMIIVYYRYMLRLLLNTMMITMLESLELTALSMRVLCSLYLAFK